MSVDPRHEESVLLPRGITAAAAEQFGVRSVLDPDDLPEELRGARYAPVPGLLFEWNSPLAGRVHQFRPDTPAKNPEGDVVKYAFAAGTSMVLNRLREPGGSGASADSLRSSAPVLLCEGTMQSLAAAIYAPPEWAVYGMSGCWSWRRGETQVATPDLLVVEGRDVVIALDADAATNLDVYNAGMALKDALQNEGASSINFLRLDGNGAKAGLDDVLGARPEHTRAAHLGRLLDRAEEKPAKAKPARKKSSSGTSVRDLAAKANAGTGSGASRPLRPVVAVNDDRRDVINQLSAALKERWDSTELFCYGGILALRQGDTVAPVTEGLFSDLVAEATLCVTVNSKGDAAPGWPDEKTCKAVLSRAERFAPLQRISRVPFVRADGSICQTPGYDQATSTFLVLDEAIEHIEIADDPAEEDVRSAVKLLTDEWLGDLMAIMPEPEDRANCLGLVLTTLIRGLVPLAPMAVIDGLQMGVGKNLLADLVSIFATGSVANPLPYSRDDQENRKVITASFRAGHDFLCFDEAHVIEGPQLARAITSITYSDRILGVSNMIEFPNRVTWLALGNNVSVNSDLSRRVYRIRLAPVVANPQDRDADEFRHPDIKGWTMQHRHELVAAALTVIRAWFAGEKKENRNGRRFGSFEQWGGMVGGILDNAGIEGFLGSLVEWRSETDYDTRFWAQHLSWLRDQFGEKDFTVADVVHAMKRESVRAAGSVEHPPRLEDHTSTGYNRTLGLAYARVKGRVIERLQLVKVYDSPGHGSRWSITSREVGGARGDDEKGLDLAGRQGSILSTKPHSAPDLGEDTRGIRGGAQPEPIAEKTNNICGYTYVDVFSSGGAAVPNSPNSPNPPEEVSAQVNHVVAADDGRLVRTVVRNEGATASEAPGKPDSAPARSAPVFPLYPRYPSTAGADPLAPLLHLAEDVPAPRCLDCDAEEELVPGTFWFGCKSCTPATFTTREGRV